MMKPLELPEDDHESDIKPSVPKKRTHRPKTPVSSGENEPLPVVGVKQGMLHGIFNKKAN